MTGKNGDGGQRSSGGPKGEIKDTLRKPLPKRFYTSVDLRPSATVSGGHEILLDGRPVRTPLKRILVAPDPDIAAVIAAEWSAQSDVIDPATMPATKLANSAIDTVADHRQSVAAEIVQYAGSDLLCYRATHPAGLVARQSAVWDPLLTAVEDALGARFVRVAGVVHAPQPSAPLDSIAACLAGVSNLTLAGVQLITTMTGSAILAMAKLKGIATASEVWSAAHVDEDWQIELWGPDEEAGARRTAQEKDFRAAAAVVGPKNR